MATHAIGNRIIVDITEADIINGQKSDCGYCPIAQAVRRWAPTADVDVDHDMIAIEDGDRTDYFIPGDAMVRFMIAFDSGEPVEPGLYEAIVEDDTRTDDDA